MSGLSAEDIILAEEALKGATPVREVIPVKNATAIDVSPSGEKARTEVSTNNALSVFMNALGNKYQDSVFLYCEMPTMCDSDYQIDRDGIKYCFVEVKVRGNRFNDFQHTILPLRKHGTAEHYFKASGIKTYYLASFSDGVVAFLDLTEEPDKVETMSSRADRGGASDIYAFYNISRFYKLNK